ncbi:MAG: ABC transporter permease subunit [Thermodesulfobacteriota bacterium]
MNPELIVESLPELLRASVLTIQLTFISLALGAILALPLALGRMSKNRWLSGFCFVYVYYFRGTPLLVQIFLIYYGLPQIGLTLGAYSSALISLSLNTAAYTAEIIRGGIQAIPAGEIESAYAMGMTRLQVLEVIIIRQMIGFALPAYGNEIILQIKATSLASTITLMDLTGMARTLASDTYAPLEIFSAAGIIYLAMVFSTSKLVAWMEKRWTVYRLERL